ncbi:hypothetical protein VN24_19075 [Paenibacillus beijingensis]|uniref:Rad50/SbcC-type AAA domain-containing protein n=2 Tax=Paenibacillus beijingensis TaxID=1126833 RepID=A0A0D5NRD9_9BACL|nr:hypothetical protein VN24_19075 [Paenibacillus beijingensis]
MIKTSRQRYGSLKKCEFHLHTPASYDYNLIEGKEYVELNDIEVINLATEEGFLTIEQQQHLLNNIDDYRNSNYKQNIEGKDIPYDSFKEYLSYMLIAYKLYKNEIEVVIISDHNTIKGYKKLKYALNEFFIQKIKGNKNIKTKLISLFLGVEISCSEKNHLIVIFDESNYNQLESYLNEIILTEKDGTYCTSLQVFEDIKKYDGIAYLAHMNTSNYNGSSAYKKKLFNLPQMNIIGLTDKTTKDRELQKIIHYNKDAKRKFGFVYEGDSHSIASIGVKSTWVKFNKVDFASLKKAVYNHNISIYIEKPNKLDKFIKGLAIETGTDGFLKSNPNNNKNPFSSKYLIIDFSRDLNCIIGGRGTGKSTLLNIIETSASLEIDEIEKLKFICRHKVIYIVFFYMDCDYILRFIPQTKDISKYYFIEDEFIEKTYKKKTKTTYTLISNHWVQLFRVQENNVFEPVPDKSVLEILQQLFKKSYSINNIINQINNGEIGQFIKDTIFYGVDYKESTELIEKLITSHDRSFNKYLRDNAIRILSAVDTHNKLVSKKIDDFNIQNSETIRIIQSPKKKRVEYYLNDLLEVIRSNSHVAGTVLTWNDVERFIIQTSKQMGYLNFLYLLFNKKFIEIDKSNQISSFVQEEKSFKLVEMELKEITKENLISIYRAIYDKITSNRNEVQRSIQKWYEVLDDFSLEFNINLKESTRTEASVIKNIEHLSLGQKVVAILTFLFNFGNYINDTTPLLIDQPEDNLDNQYIYKNLVESLKKIKNNRQVIIATHSSTIVTNADAEQVIVMDSNYKNAWIEAKGYPSDKLIIRHILNYMEGGKESFKHKIETYSLYEEDLILKH